MTKIMKAAAGALLASSGLLASSAPAGIIAWGNASGQITTKSAAAPYGGVSTAGYDPITDVAFLTNGNVVFAGDPSTHQATVRVASPNSVGAPLYSFSYGIVLDHPIETYLAPLSDGRLFVADTEGYAHLMTDHLVQYSEPGVTSYGTGFNSVVSVSQLAGGNIAVASNNFGGNADATIVRIITTTDVNSSYAYQIGTGVIGAGAAMSDGRYVYGDTAGNVTILHLAGPGNMTTDTTGSGFGTVSAIAQFQNGDLAVADEEGTIRVVTSSDLGTPLMSAAGLGDISDMVVLPDGNLAYSTTAGDIRILDPLNNLASLAVPAGFSGNGNLSALATAVPEPSALLLVVAPMLLLARRRG
jgi:hypothetical protein